MSPLRYSDISLDDYTIAPLRGPVGKRFGSVGKKDKKKVEKLTFQIPPSVIAFEPNQYFSLSVRIDDPGFVAFLKTLRENVCRDLETPEVDIGLNESDNPAMLPLFRLKVSDETSYYDMESKRAEASKVLAKGSEIHIQIQLNCTYHVEGRYGVSWKALQIRLGKEPELMSPSSPVGSDGDFLD